MKLKSLIQTVAGMGAIALGTAAFAEAADGIVVCEGFELAPFFQDHCVLQRDQPLRIWGKAPTDTAVTVAFGGATATGVFEEGTNIWVATFADGFAASSESRELAVTCVRAGETVGRTNISDVVVGDVWIAAGQSNMGFSICNTTGYANEFKPEFPALRQKIRGALLSVAERGSWPTEPQTYDLKITGWALPSDETSFRYITAEGYHFARKLTQELDVPVAIVETALNAMPASVWLPGGAFWNFHIVPLHRLSFKGVVWHQGEGAGISVEPQLTQVVNDWRENFGRTPDELPFYAIQFPGYGPFDYDDPSGDTHAGMRAAREGTGRVVESVSNVHMAVVWDAGDPSDIHTREKWTPGQRLAISALHHSYARADGQHDGPIWKTLATADGATKLRLGFDMCGAGGFATATKDWATNTPPVATPGVPVTGLAVAGVNHVWDWADEVAFGEDGASLVVSAKKCAKPVYARFAFFANPYEDNANLYGDGLIPVSPFATDYLYYAPRYPRAFAPLGAKLTADVVGENAVVSAFSNATDKVTAAASLRIKDAYVQFAQQLNLSEGVTLTVDGAEITSWMGLYLAKESSVVFENDGSLIRMNENMNTGNLMKNGAANAKVVVRNGRSQINRLDWMGSAANSTDESFVITNAEYHAERFVKFAETDVAPGAMRLALRNGPDRAARIVTTEFIFTTSNGVLELNAPAGGWTSAPILGRTKATVSGAKLVIDATNLPVPAAGCSQSYPLVTSTTALVADAAALQADAEVTVREGAGWELAVEGTTLALVLSGQGAVTYCTVTFQDIDGATIGTPQQVRAGRTATVPAAPRISGKTFTGWMSDGTLYTPDEVAALAIAADTVFRATYEEGGPVFDDEPCSYGWKAGEDGSWGDKTKWNGSESAKLGYPDDAAYAAATFGADIVSDANVTFVEDYAAASLAFANVARVNFMGTGTLTVGGSVTLGAGAELSLENGVRIAASALSAASTAALRLEGARATAACAVSGTLALADGFRLSVGGTVESGDWPIATFAAFSGNVSNLVLEASVASCCTAELALEANALILRVREDKPEPQPGERTPTDYGYYLDVGLGAATNRVCVFTNVTQSWSWTVPTGVTKLDYLVVGGGGGGGYQYGGGGGGGGVLAGSDFAVTAGASLTVTVGAGGAGALKGETAGGMGADSSFTLGEVTRKAGGGGGGGTLSNVGVAGLAGTDGQGGGSGGGGSQGKAGGKGVDGGFNGAGGTSPGGSGGGGAESAGTASTMVNGKSGKAGDGGAGYASDITGAEVAYAGGGGGGGNANATYAWGYGGEGKDGGGNGGTHDASVSIAPTAGEDGLGGGGGGGAHEGNVGYAGARGGSGVVILRYELPTSEPETPQVVVDGKVVDFNADLFTSGTTNLVTTTNAVYLADKPTVTESVDGKVVTYGGTSVTLRKYYDVTLTQVTPIVGTLAWEMTLALNEEAKPTIGSKDATKPFVVGDENVALRITETQPGLWYAVGSASSPAAQEGEWTVGEYLQTVDFTAAKAGNSRYYKIFVRDYQ